MEQNSNGQGASASASAAVFQVQRIYLKDASLEMPNAPGVFLEQGQPQIDVQLDVSSDSLAEGIVEVTIRVTVTAKVRDKVLFLVEAKQAGIFELRGIPQEQVEQILNILCPSIVYPYLRSNVADLVSRTGMPPIHLNEINFEVIYRQKLAQAAGASPLIVPPGSSTRQ
jgi:preprotein translocase subunit SecB